MNDTCANGRCTRKREPHATKCAQCLASNARYMARKRSATKNRVEMWTGLLGEELREKLIAEVHQELGI